jgi:hypothetical protein
LGQIQLLKYLIAVLNGEYDLNTNLKLLKQILENEEEEIDIPIFGKITVKLPTVREKLGVKESLSKIPSFNLLSPVDATREESRLLALIILRNPKISITDYLDYPDLKMTALLDSVAMWYTLKLKSIDTERKGQIDSFLSQMKES